MGRRQGAGERGWANRKPSNIVRDKGSRHAPQRPAADLQPPKGRRRSSQERGRLPEQRMERPAITDPCSAGSRWAKQARRSRRRARLQRRTDFFILGPDTHIDDPLILLGSPTGLSIRHWRACLPSCRGGRSRTVLNAPPFALFSPSSRIIWLEAFHEESEECGTTTTRKKEDRIALGQGDGGEPFQVAFDFQFTGTITQETRAEGLLAARGACRGQRRRHRLFVNSPAGHVESATASTT